MSSTTGQPERLARGFEDAISDADFLDDDAYAFYSHGAPARKSGFALRAFWKAAVEVASVFALFVVVTIVAMVGRLRGDMRA